MKKKYFGVVAPLVTPINSSGTIDNASVERLITHVIDANNYPFILGTTGEIASVSQKNKEQLAQVAVKVANRKKTLLAGITDNCIENTIYTAKIFSEIGVDIFVVHLPYFLPIGDDQMLRYFENIANNSPRPIMIYNIVSITHMSIPINVIEKLSYHPNIIGLKDSEKDWDRHQRMAKLFKDREDFVLFIGWTNKSSESIAIGFDGIIPNTANIVPQLFESLYEAASSGNTDRALMLQEKSEKLSDLVQNNKSMTRTIPELKAIMDHLNICDPYVFPPLESLKKSESEQLFHKFNKLNI